MRNEITVLPVLWSRKDKDGLFPIKIRITKNRKSNYIPVGYAVKKSDWSEFKRKVKTTNLYHLIINEKIDEILSEIENTNPTLDFQPKSKNSFLKYLLQKIDDKKKGNKFFSTKRYRSLYFHLEKFVGNVALPFFKQRINIII
jgi:hypothetical protein